MFRHMRFSLKVALLLLTISLIALSAACQRATPSPTPTTAVLPDTTSQEEIELTFAGYASQRSLYEPLIGEFHRQHPDITVRFVELPEPSGQAAGSKQERLKELSSAADTVIISGEDSRYAGPYFKDLQSLMDIDPDFQPDDFWSGALSACQDSQESMLGLPLTLGLHGIYFDEQAFDEAGLPLPVPGWTWDDFRQAVSALASEQEEAMRYGFLDGNATFTSILGPLVDADLIANDGEIDAIELQSRFQWYFDLADARSLFGMQVSSQEERAALFQSGAPPAMWTGYLVTPLPWSEGGSAGGDLWDGMALSTMGFVPFPIDENISRTTPAFAYCAAISSGTRQPQAAWAWISFLSSKWLTPEEFGGLWDCSDSCAPIGRGGGILLERSA
jgi:ABC-type glycerol-3-phosphate transport system substrate-binding protein